MKIKRSKLEKILTEEILNVLMESAASPRRIVLPPETITSDIGTGERLRRADYNAYDPIEPEESSSTLPSDYGTGERLMWAPRQASPESYYPGRPATDAELASPQGYTALPGITVRSRPATPPPAPSADINPKTGEPGYRETLARNRRSSEGTQLYYNPISGRQWYDEPDEELQWEWAREKRADADLQRRRQEESGAFEQAVAEGGEAEAIQRLSQPAPQRQYIHPDDPTRALTGEDYLAAVRDPVRNAELTSAWFVPEFGGPGEVSGYRPATEREAELGRNWRLTDDATRQMTGRSLDPRGRGGLVHQGTTPRGPFSLTSPGMTPEEARAFLSDKEYEEPSPPSRRQRRMSRRALAAKVEGSPQAHDAAYQAAMEQQAEYGAERRRYEASSPAYANASTNLVPMSDFDREGNLVQVMRPARSRGWWWDPEDERNMGRYDPWDPEGPRNPWEPFDFSGEADFVSPRGERRETEAGGQPVASLREFVEKEIDKTLMKIK